MSLALSASQIDLGELATGSKGSRFQVDYSENAQRIRERLNNARLLVIGGGGSIGGAVVRLLAGFPLSALHVVDINENSLAELVRDLRSSQERLQAGDFRLLPLDFGDATLCRLVTEEEPYDFVLNFAAVKHVRSEKDIYSIMRMLSVNVLMQDSLLGWVRARSSQTSYFSVSTDKAANPVNLMGASKRLMEHVMFASPPTPGSSRAVTSARFANVAFSEGSLLQSWLIRLSKSQPISVPRATKRFFVSVQESGQLCMLGAFSTPTHRILIPKMLPDKHLVELEQIAIRFLEHSGFEPSFYDSERLAQQAVEQDKSKGRYPLLLTPLDTMGEKSFEEFVARDEQATDVGFRDLAALSYVAGGVSQERLAKFIVELRRIIDSPEVSASKAQFVQMVSEILGNFAHSESSKKLDERM